MDKEVFDDFEDLVNENSIIYSDLQLNEPYYEIIKPLMKMLFERLFEDLQAENEKSPVYFHFLRDPAMGKYYWDPKGKVITEHASDIVTDFIASMSDDYFIDVCKYLHLDDELVSKVRYYEYFEGKWIQ